MLGWHIRDKKNCIIYIFTNLDTNRRTCIVHNFMVCDVMTTNERWDWPPLFSALFFWTFILPWIVNFPLISSHPAVCWCTAEHLLFCAKLFFFFFLCWVRDSPVDTMADLQIKTTGQFSVQAFLNQYIVTMSVQPLCAVACASTSVCT